MFQSSIWCYKKRVYCHVWQLRPAWTWSGSKLVDRVSPVAVVTGHPGVFPIQTLLTGTLYHLWSGFSVWFNLLGAAWCGLCQKWTCCMFSRSTDPLVDRNRAAVLLVETHVLLPLCQAWRTATAPGGSCWSDSRWHHQIGFTFVQQEEVMICQLYLYQWVKHINQKHTGLTLSTKTV